MVRSGRVNCLLDFASRLVLSRVKWLSCKGDGIVRERAIPGKVSSESQPVMQERSKSEKLLVYKQLCAVVEGTHHLLRRRAGFILGENLEIEGDGIMPLVSLRQLLDEAAKKNYGVGAFNVNDMEQIQAIMEA